MKVSHFILAMFFVSFSLCKNLVEEKTSKTINEEPIVSIVENSTTSVINDEKEDNKNQTDCVKFWNLLFPSKDQVIEYLDKIIANSHLTENNKKFISKLKTQKKSELVIEQPLFPIFKLSENEIGIFAFPVYQKEENKYIDISKELEIIEKFAEVKNYKANQSGELQFYPEVLDFFYLDKTKPIFNYYTTSTYRASQVKDLGIFVDICLEYYEYSFDISNLEDDDKVLFGSKLKIDLVFENNASIDSLLKNQVKEECLDCPNSLHLERTFAKLEGTDNVYFVFADTFPLNNELDTPSRGLIFINEKNEIIHLWYKEIDLFGCSCL